MPSKLAGVQSPLLEGCGRATDGKGGCGGFGFATCLDETAEAAVPGVLPVSPGVLPVSPAAAAFAAAADA